MPFMMGVWLIIGGALLALGNPTLAQTSLSFLVPLTLVAMGVWAILRAIALHRQEERLPRGLFWGELLFVLVLLLVYTGIRTAPLAREFPLQFTRASHLITIPSPPPMPSVSLTPLEQLPKNPRLLMIRQMTSNWLPLDITGGDSFEVSPKEGEKVRAMALNRDIVRIEIYTGSPVHLKVPKSVTLEVEGRYFVRLNIRDMEGDVRVTYGGQNPIVLISTKGDITVRQVSSPVHYARTDVDELTIFPGPDSRVQVSAIRETVHINAQQLPRKPWDVKVERGRIEVYLPDNSSVRLRATCSVGMVQVSFGQGKRRQFQRQVSSYYEHIGTLGKGKVPINLSIRHGDIVVELTRSAVDG